MLVLHAQSFNATGVPLTPLFSDLELNVKLTSKYYVMYCDSKSIDNIFVSGVGVFPCIINQSVPLIAGTIDLRLLLT
jgi:hypothetical protein